ncbi:MAG: hypothetical protein JO217_11305 [Acidobacteriaceae bacterium]|nr:hypothetical protein [Acidobacteriaceae bacterium]
MSAAIGVQCRYRNPRDSLLDVDAESPEHVPDGLAEVDPAEATGLAFAAFGTGRTVDPNVMCFE